MEEKYQWAEESLGIIRHEGSDYAPTETMSPTPSTARTYRN